MERLLTKRWVHENYVVSLLAEIHEGETSCGILGEKLSLELVAVLSLFGILAKGLDYLGLGLLKKLLVGDVGQIEERMLSGLSGNPIQFRLREQKRLAFAIYCSR